jgi:hypothetical protein
VKCQPLPRHAAGVHEGAGAQKRLSRAKEEWCTALLRGDAVWEGVADRFIPGEMRLVVIVYAL